METPRYVSSSTAATAAAVQAAIFFQGSVFAGSGEAAGASGEESLEGDWGEAAGVFEETFGEGSLEESKAAGFCTEYSWEEVCGVSAALCRESSWEGL